MRPALLFIILTYGAMVRAEASDCFVTNCADVTRILRDGTNTLARFSLTVHALSDVGEYGRGIVIGDESGATLLSPGEAFDMPPPLRNGDRFTVSGRVCTPPTSGRFIRAEKIVRLGREAPYVPPTRALDAFARQRDGYRPVRLCGTVSAVKFDEIDPRFSFLVLEDGDSVVYVACPYPDGDRKSAQALIGAEIQVAGIRDHRRPENRRHIGAHLMTGPDKIKVIHPPPSDPFAVLDMEELAELGPMEVVRSGPHRTCGAVLAVWQSSQILIRRKNGELSRIELQEGPAPTPGTFIEVVGHPVSDLYHLNLVRARWRTASGHCPTPEAVVRDVRSADILKSAAADRLFVPSYHGKLLRVTGTIVDRTGASLLSLQDGTGLVSIDISACTTTSPNCPIGSVIRATGVCIMDIPAWQPHKTFPQLSGFRIITRQADDLELVASPPWWTSARAWTVFGILLAALCGVFVWNALLRRLVEKRSRQLAEEAVARTSADLKVYERTRLAVELHDSLAQNLTGVSLEIDTAGRLADTDPLQMHEHLGIASRSLKSCRAELRNCLWDLRHQTLENDSMEDAIRQTLAPHIRGVDVSVRFRVPRERISDNTAHAILNIVRELTLNAIRHGKASTVKVAGSIEDAKLLFSVRDNGCGFDPATAPGGEQGHYGLLGIHERVNSFEGKLTLDSVPGKGTKVTVHLNIPQEQPC